LPKLKGKKYIHVGGLSNVMFRKDYNGIILHSKIKDIEIIDDSVIKVGAGLKVNDFVEYCISNDVYLPILKQIFGIPAEIGGILVNNATLSDTIEKSVIKVHCINMETGEIKDFTTEECCFQYRKTIFKDTINNKWAIIYVYFKYYSAKNNKEDLYLILENRNKHFIPTTNEGYSGCMFHVKNDHGAIGRYLYDKEIINTTYNNVYILKSFPFRFVNKDNKCSGEDLFQLSEIVMKKIYDKYGVKIDREVQFV
jgi:UDP-N-acetylenolpyruvoylglucosamine reductase